MPTDLAESESELVAGFTTEYSAMRFGMFFVVLFSNVFFVSAMITMLYLGGWQCPFGTMLPILERGARPPHDGISLWFPPRPS